MNSTKTILIADACVLISLVHIGKSAFLKQLIFSCGFEVVVPSVVLNEVEEEISETQLLSLGVRIFASTKTIAKAIEKERRELKFSSLALSDQDIECLFIALHENGILWTNDKNLKKSAELCGVCVYRLMRPLIIMQERGLLLREDLLDIAKQIEANEKWLPRGWLALIEEELNKQERR